ncbi:MAG TPA: outer membrane beta-barrel protein [Terracidiphilus sp.]|jgi:opacity protein-like surface antigen|nr:outer membrane beta-barrel protein [Terracidiphilus sp.]
MRSYLIGLLVFMGLMVTTSAAQAVPGAQSGGIPLSVGLGVSAYNVNWGNGLMYGGTIWADYMLTRLPDTLHGLGIEAQGQVITLNRGNTRPSNFRLDVVGGGPIYFVRVRRVPNLRFYAKDIIGYGGIDWNNPDPQFTHETRTINAPGGGFEYRMFGRYLARADYEYQIWPAVGTQRPYYDPQGFTFGVMYDFAYRRPRF